MVVDTVNTAEIKDDNADFWEKEQDKFLIM